MAKPLKAPGGTAFRFIGKQSLKSLLIDVRKLQARGAEANGKLGELLKSAEESKNLHRPSFQQAARLERMEGSKLRTWLAHFDFYREALQLDKRANEQGDFIADGEEADAEAETGEAEAAPAKPSKAAGRKKPSATAQASSRKPRKTMGELLHEPGAALHGEGTPADPTGSAPAPTPEPGTEAAAMH